MHRLALALGCTIKELSNRMTLDELIEWMAFYELEPWGDNLNGIRIATNTAAVANAGFMNAAPKAYNKKAFKPKDFFIGVYAGPKVEQTWEQQKSMLQKLTKKGVSNVDVRR